MTEILGYPATLTLKTETGDLVLDDFLKPPVGIDTFTEPAAIDIDKVLDAIEEHRRLGPLRAAVRDALTVTNDDSRLYYLRRIADLLGVGDDPGVAP